MISLRPLLDDREKCLCCEDVEGVESIRLRRVEFFFPGRPYQRVSRESNALFDLERWRAFQWPVIHRMVEASFLIKPPGDQFQGFTFSTVAGIIVKRAEDIELIGRWGMKRGFIKNMPLDQLKYRTYQEVYGTPTRLPVLDLGTEERTSLAPLVEMGRNSLACRDVEGVAKVELQEVRIEYFGWPYQIIRRQSDDLFRLLEEGAFRWPPLLCMRRAVFRMRLDGSKKASRVTISAPCFGNRGMVQIERTEESAAIRQFLAKRCFLEA